MLTGSDVHNVEAGIITNVIPLLLLWVSFYSY